MGYPVTLQMMYEYNWYYQSERFQGVLFRTLTPHKPRNWSK